MKWRTEKTSVAMLIFMAGLAVLSLLFAERSITLIRQPFYEQKLKAAKTMLIAMNTIKDYRIDRGLPLDTVNDPNATGLIGSEFTLITTDRGNVTSKLTTTNPNFAAVVVDMLTKAKLKKGDVVALGMTGSFPSLNIATLAAIETLELNPIIITSVGSSSWGANDSDMTWLDMERILNEKSILRIRSIAASIGGGKDIGRGLSPQGRDLILQAIHRNGILVISESLLEDNIQTRIKLYEKVAHGKKIKAYINVGGGVASLGSPINGDLIPSGLSRNLGFRNFPTKGVMILMAERGIPVIHLLNISGIARNYNLPISPAPLPELGQGPVYFKERYDRLRLILIAAMLIGATVAIVRINLFHYFAQLRQIRSRGIYSGSSMLPPIDIEQGKIDTQLSQRRKK